MDRYAVIGHPVAHSLSPEIHQRFAAQTGQSISYRRIEAPLAGFVKTVVEFAASGARGCNVTVPFKEVAALWVDHQEPGAEFAGAVNTIVIEDDGSSTGHNTDGPGLTNDLRRVLGTSDRMRVLLVGAGGAALGVARPLIESLAGELVVANRTPARAENLVERLSAVTWRPVLATAFDALEGPFDLVINATSAGLDGGVPDIAPAVVRSAFCYDLLYGKATTFCRWSLESGARDARDGLGMLVEQAALAFELWRGVLPDTAPVLAQLRRELAT